MFFSSLKLAEWFLMLNCRDPSLDWLNYWHESTICSRRIWRKSNWNFISAVFKFIWKCFRALYRSYNNMEFSFWINLTFADRRFLWTVSNAKYWDRMRFCTNFTRWLCIKESIFMTETSVVRLNLIVFIWFRLVFAPLHL